MNFSNALPTLDSKQRQKVMRPYLRWKKLGWSIADIPGGHCKNLFCKDEKGVLWLIVCLEDCLRRFEGGTRKNRLPAALLRQG